MNTYKIKIASRLSAALAAALMLGGCTTSAEDAETTSAPESSLIQGQSTSYDLYVGMIDKDSLVQELTLEEAKEIASQVFNERGIGNTVYDAEGGYQRQDGTFVTNDTLVYTGLHCDEETATEIIAELKESLNIESVYYQVDVIYYDMDSGVIS